MTKFEKFSRWLYQLNEFNLLVAFCVLAFFGLPFYLCYRSLKEMWERYRPRTEEEKKCAQREKIKKEIESGKVRLRDLPRNHPPQHELFDFEKVEHSRYRRKYLIYVATSDDRQIGQFFENEKEWLEKWSWKYGLHILHLDDQEQLFEQMCYPQDKVHLHHGFLRDLNYWTGDREYGASVMPFRYYPLEDESVMPLKEQMEMMAQDIYEEPFC